MASIMVLDEEKEDAKGGRPTAPTGNPTTGWTGTIKKVEIIYIDFKH